MVRLTLLNLWKIYLLCKCIIKNPKDYKKDDLDPTEDIGPYSECANDVSALTCYNLRYSQNFRDKNALLSIKVHSEYELIFLIQKELVRVIKEDKIDN